jgi:hypothetical protein
VARKRQWSQLSANYQRRLRAAGVSKEQYESGVSLKKARGHENTPENSSHRRRILANKMFEKKKRVFGDRISWNEQEAKRIILHGSSGAKGDPVEPLSNDDMEFLLEMDDYEYEEFIDGLDYDATEDQKYAAAAFYH